MDELETLRNQLVAAGYWPNIAARPEGWECTLWNRHNVGTLKSQHQPIGRGATAVEAVRMAIAARDARKAAA